MQIEKELINSLLDFVHKEILNGGEGSGDFDHAGRIGIVGGSEPAGTGRKGKYKDGKRQWVGAKSETKKEKVEEVEKEIVKNTPEIKKVDVEEPKLTNKQEGEFLIKKETSKAVYLDKDGVSFWVPKRYFKDGKLTPAGERILEEKKEMNKAVANLEKKGIEFEPAWSSDKAFGIDTLVEDYTGSLKTVRVFVPKSQIMDNGNIPLWLFKKKIQEINEKVGINRIKGNYGSGFKIDFYQDKVFLNSAENKIYTILNNTLYVFKEEKQDETN